MTSRSWFSSDEPGREGLFDRWRRQCRHLSERYARMFGGRSPNEDSERRRLVDHLFVFLRWGYLVGRILWFFAERFWIRP